MFLIDFNEISCTDRAKKEIRRKRDKQLSDFNFLLRNFCSTFVCPTEIIAFSERVAEFRANNCEVVGVSTGE